MSAELRQLVEAWRQVCRELTELARSIPREQWDLPTDLEGWSVKDNIAHVAHLEAVLAGAPEETIEVEPAPHLTGVTSYYTEQGVLARRDRDVETLCSEIDASVEQRHAELLTDPPTDPSAPPPRTPGGVPWGTGTLLANRVLDVWMHSQGIRRAVDRPGGYGTAAAAVTIDRLGGGLPMVVGKRVAPPPGTVVRVEVPEAGVEWTVAVADDGRARLVEATDDPAVAIRLSAEDFVVLAGGRRTPADTTAEISAETSGGQELGLRVLAALAMTP